jgi:hypothetical protein
VDIGNLSVMVGILDVDDPKREVDAVRKHLVGGDIVVFPAEAYHEVSDMKRGIEGLAIGTGGTRSDLLLEGASRIPEDVEYVTYDYEPDYTPEFTYDQSGSIGIFSKLKEKSNSLGKGLIVVPVYVYGKSWDWGEAAKETDVLVVQVQNFQRGFNGPKELRPESIGKDLRRVAEELVSEIRQKSPSTKIYLQMGLSFGSSPEDILKDIEDVRDSGIDGITIWHNPGLSGKSSSIGDLERVLGGLVRT